MLSRALHVAYALALATAGSLRVLGVLAEDVVARGCAREARVLRAAKRRVMRAAVTVAAGSLPGDVRCDTWLLDAAAPSSPRRALASVSQRLDILVVGSRRRGRFGRTLTGSVSGALLRDAACPVVAVPSQGSAALVRALAPHAAAA
jgi:nucleotide-binding universal stress UspA family protein